MKKRLIALILCLAMAIPLLVGCAGSIDADSEYKGEQITMYLTEEIYNLDPAYAYLNDSTRSIISLLFDTLFVLDEKGKVKPSLADNYKTEKNDDGYFMYINIREDARWSDNQSVTADDVVFAWKRVLNPNNSFGSAYLLFDIKNARAYNNADVSKDDVGLTADGKLLTIQFEGETNYDQFLLNLTSLVLAPLREDIASKSDDWAKKPGIMTSSGPFKLSKLGVYKNKEVVYEDINYSVKQIDENNMVILDKNDVPVYKDATEPDSFAEQNISSYILERNMYYYRDAEDGAKLDVSVTPYRIIVDCSLTDEEILEGYKKGVIAYLGDIPVSIRNDPAMDKVVFGDSFSTSLLYINQNVGITRILPKDEITTETETESETETEEVTESTTDTDSGTATTEEPTTAETETCNGKHEIISAGFDGHREAACDICNKKEGKINAHDYKDLISCSVCGYERPTEATDLFDKIEIRQVLSMAIDRNAIAEKLVYAEAATGLVPNGIFDTNNIKSLFRDNAKNISKYLDHNTTAAADLLKTVKIDGKNIVPSEYCFKITVSSHNEEHRIIAEELAKAWGPDGLGFNVTVNDRGTIENNDFHRDVAGVPTDFCDDLWEEDIKTGNYEVALLDLAALSADSISVLAPFAKGFSGQAMDMSDTENSPTHPTGYDSEQYNALINKIYNNKDIESRSDDLHKAEDILMNDLPVIPILFNKSAYLINEDILDLNNKILFWDKTGEYYNPVIFDKLAVKNYEEYELTCAKYVFEKYDSWTQKQGSYFNINFAEMDKESFVYTNSNYYYLFKDKFEVDKYEWMPAKPEKK